LEFPLLLSRSSIAAKKFFNECNFDNAATTRRESTAAPDERPLLVDADCGNRHRFPVEDRTVDGSAGSESLLALSLLSQPAASSTIGAGRC
jgi:hypothetical protein